MVWTRHKSTRKFKPKQNQLIVINARKRLPLRGVMTGSGHKGWETPWIKLITSSFSWPCVQYMNVFILKIHRLTLVIYTFHTYTSIPVYFKCSMKLIPWNLWSCRRQWKVIKPKNFWSNLLLNCTVFQCLKEIYSCLIQNSSCYTKQLHRNCYNSVNVGTSSFRILSN